MTRVVPRSVCPAGVGADHGGSCWVPSDQLHSCHPERLCRRGYRMPSMTGAAMRLVDSRGANCQADQYVLLGVGVILIQKEELREPALRMRNGKAAPTKVADDRTSTVVLN